jgi:gamma-glutamylcyclotransferase (GGCT)/AIG2-like uncharacterized protein YtfP
MKRIAVYGSLKKGKYNYRGDDKMKFIGDSTIMGSMFLCHSYPHLYPVERSVAEQVMVYPVELYEVDEDTFAGLDRMETGAGYKGEMLPFETSEGTVEAILWFKNGEGKDSTLPYITSY